MAKKRRSFDGTFGVDEVDNYANQGVGKYFKLAKDGDKARIRFMYKDIEDMRGTNVHKLNMPNGGFASVKCIRPYNAPKSECPLCEAGNKATPSLIAPVYNVDEERAQILDKGVRFLRKAASKCAKYGKKGEICQTIFEVERVGDNFPDYEIDFDDRDKVTMDDLPDAEDLLDGYVLEKSFDDMEYFVENNEFPPEDSVPRRAKKKVEEEDDEDDEGDYDDEEDDDEDDDEDLDDDEDDDDEDDDEDDDNEDDDDDDDDDEDEDDEDEDDDAEDEEIEDEDEEDEYERPVRRKPAPKKQPVKKAAARKVPAKKKKR